MFLLFARNPHWFVGAPCGWLAADQATLESAASITRFPGIEFRPRRYELSLSAVSGPRRPSSRPSRNGPSTFATIGSFPCAWAMHTFPVSHRRSGFAGRLKEAARPGFGGKLARGFAEGTSSGQSKRTHSGPPAEFGVQPSKPFVRSRFSFRLSRPGRVRSPPASKKLGCLLHGPGFARATVRYQARWIFRGEAVVASPFVCAQSPAAAALPGKRLRIFHLRPSNPVGDVGGGHSVGFLGRFPAIRPNSREDRPGRARSLPGVLAFQPVGNRPSVRNPDGGQRETRGAMGGLGGGRSCG